jgi:hypothetical protein
MTEPDVTLTDYAIAVECAVFCALILRSPTSDVRLRRWWAVLFASIGAGAFLGGTVHGFTVEPSLSRAILWVLTMLALGVTAMAMWMAGARVYLPEPAATWVARAAIAQLITYAFVVLFVNRLFLVAIATYLPAAVFLLVVMILMYRRMPNRPLALTIAGLLLTFVAAGIQQAGIAVHPVYFNHNALYHVIQGVALFLIWVGAKWLVTAAPGSSVRATG